MWLSSSINKSKNYPFLRALGSDQCGDKNSDENHPINGVMLPYVTGAGLYNGSIMEWTLCRPSICCQSMAATQFVAPSAPALTNGGNEMFQNLASNNTPIVTKTQYWFLSPLPPSLHFPNQPSSSGTLWAKPLSPWFTIARSASLQQLELKLLPTYPTLPTPSMFIHSPLSINIWKWETLTLHWSDKTVGFNRNISLPLLPPSKAVALGASCSCAIVPGDRLASIYINRVPAFDPAPTIQIH